ncbi:hypothetical protein C8R47DRAFT_1200348 [Mycena vitilis]|nr:hypothetical protein C8R47DRAFT_1200348 [Mycena vitilis]
MWDSRNHSCGYDATFTILANLWREDDRWRNIFARESLLLSILNDQFQLALTGNQSLEEARNYARRWMHSSNPVDFPYGQSTTSIDRIAAVLLPPKAHAVGTRYCAECGYTDHSEHQLFNAFLSAGLNRTRDHPEGVKISTWLHGVLTNGMHHHQILFDPILQFDQMGTLVRLRLRGIIYAGGSHFTCRFLESNRDMWFHDGIATGRGCVRHGTMNAVEHQLDLHRYRNLDMAANMRAGSTMIPARRCPKAATLYNLCHSLPLELLQLILKCAVLENPNPLSVAKQRSRICMSSKFLAGVLYSVAPVWDYLYLAYNSGITRESLDASIKNSVLRPLSLAVRVWRGPDGPLVEDHTRNVQIFLHTFLSILEIHFHRVRAVDIVCWDRQSSELILAYLTKFDCSLVDDMRLSLSLSLNPDVDVLRRPFVSSLPSLRTLRFQRSFLPSCFRQLGQSVTDLRIALIKETDRATWEDVRHMLSSFPQLTRLELGGVPCAFFPSVPPPRIRFLHLTHLCIMVGSKSMMDVVQTLSTPALTHLHLVTQNRQAITSFVSSCLHLLNRPRHVRFDFAGNFRVGEIAAVLDSFLSATHIDLSHSRSLSSTHVLSALKMLNNHLLQNIFLPPSFGEEDIGEALTNRSLLKCKLIASTKPRVKSEVSLGEPDIPRTNASNYPNVLVASVGF